MATTSHALPFGATAHCHGTFLMQRIYTCLFIPCATPLESVLLSCSKGWANTNPNPMPQLISIDSKVNSTFILDVTRYTIVDILVHSLLVRRVRLSCCMGLQQILKSCPNLKCWLTEDVGWFSTCDESAAKTPSRIFRQFIHASIIVSIP
jgi:hypothetical protein